MLSQVDWKKKKNLEELQPHEVKDVPWASSNICFSGALHGCQSLWPFMGINKNKRLRIQIVMLREYVLHILCKTEVKSN